MFTVFRNLSLINLLLIDAPHNAHADVAAEAVNADTAADRGR